MNDVMGMDRRDFLAKVGLGTAAVLTRGVVFGEEDSKENPNILFILAELR